MSESPYSEQRKIFIELLRECRSTAGVTQAQLASQIGWVQSDMSKVERGVRKLDVVELRLWLSGLGGTLEDFASELTRRLDAAEALRAKMSVANFRPKTRQGSR